MTKVTLIGDSIRGIGYGTVVPQMLGEGYTVFQPGENCRFAKYTLRGMYDWREGMSGSDIIHWNNGLWDVTECVGDGVFTELDEYVSTMLRVAKILKSRAKEVIFATTTPVRHDIELMNPRIELYNATLVPLLQDMGIRINDLYTLVNNNLETFVRDDDKIHLTEAGISACAIQVINAIKQAEAL